MMPVSELRLDPLVPVPDHVAVQHVYEPVHRDAREAALVEANKRNIGLWYELSAGETLFVIK